VSGGGCSGGVCVPDSARCAPVPSPSGGVVIVVIATALELPRGTKSASKANSKHLLRWERLCLAQVAKRLLRPDRCCSELTAQTSDASLNSTSAPSKHSANSKGTPTLFAASSMGSPALSSYGNQYLTLAPQSLSAISKRWHAPLRSPSSPDIHLKLSKHRFEHMFGGGLGAGCPAGGRGGADGMETREPQPTQSLA